MNIIVEDVDSMKFFTGEGQWTRNADDDKHHAGTIQAYSAARNEPIGKFNVTGYIAGTKQLISLRNGGETGAHGI